MALFPRDRLMSSNKQLLTQGLFVENKYQSGIENSPFTLKEFKVGDAISMYQEYMKFDTEYEAAQHILGSWTHWKRLCECTWFQPYVGYWRDEMAIRNEALGKASIIAAVEEGNVAASKALVELENKRGKGRPTKSAVEGEKKRQAAVDTKVSSILERMNGK